MSRLIRKIVPVLILLIVPILSFAQTDPGSACDDQDPLDNYCPVPLDNWVYLLAFLALAAGVWYINKNKKSLFA